MDNQQENQNPKRLGHVMIDIETLGNTSASAIISIGAVRFDIDTGEIGDKFHLKVSLDSSVNLGLKMNPSTVLWWLEQTKEAQDKMFKNPDNVPIVPISQALLSLQAFISKEDIVWGNSARFDLGILGDAYNLTTLRIPWNFRNERCLRTLVAFAPHIKEEWERSGISHDAQDDCLNQINYCCEIWKKLRI